VKYSLSFFVLFASMALNTLEARENRDFKSFFAEGHEVRMEHIDKMHRLKLEQLERSTQQKREAAQKIFALENQLEPGQKEKNQKIREEIRQIRVKSRENNKLANQSLRQAQQEYREAMKKRRSALKELGLQGDEPKERGRRRRQKD
jgi:hypothetical protein